MKISLHVQLAAFLILSLPVYGHHSFPGVYDVDQRYLLQGVITKLWFRNPHSFIQIEVRESDGSVVEWYLELPPAWAMRRAGFISNVINEGDELLVTCNPARSGNLSCGLGQQGGFYRLDDGLLYGKDPREVKDPANR